jgi:spore coat polysaccharide biosynthesis protein SpsF
MRKLIIVQARMGSSRLPGKVLKEVCGKTILEHLIIRLKRVKQIDKIVVATTIEEQDNQIVDLCIKINTPFYRGSEDDVLSRYYEAALKNRADLVIRVTGDCPLIDPQIIDRIITYYIDNKNSVDYVSNILNRTYPRGMDVEVFSFSILKEANEEAAKDKEREHVTPFIISRPSRYRLHNIEHSTNLSHYRLTIDTSEDLDLVKKIFKELFFTNPEFRMKDILTVLEVNSEWLSINSHVIHKSQRSHQN